MPRTELRSRRLAVACTGAIAWLASPAWAQPDAAAPAMLDKVVVTGSHIPRSEVESALPVQVITREEIERSGATTVAEVMAKVSANVLGFNDQLSVSDPLNGGLSSINLRALGDGATLVLLNGRRVANYAFAGIAVDVNSIPLSAVDRVEILKDGASAIYGTDAMAGVVNFILRKDFQGVEASAFGSWPQHGGGEQWQATATAGTGDLAKDRYNLFVSATVQKDSALNASERPFSRTAYIPEAGIIQLSPATFPANIVALNQLFNPSFASGCAPPTSHPSTIARSPGDACGFDSASVSVIIPAAERWSVYGRGTFQASPQHQLFAEAGWASNRLTLSLAPAAIAPFTNPDFKLVIYPAGGPYYPSAFALANGISGDLELLYRTVPLGNQTSVVDTSAWRTVIGADGEVGGWGYGTALAYSQTDQSHTMTSGYVSVQRTLDAIATGLVNPFGASGAEGNALLAAAQVTGKTRFAQGTTLAFDFRATRDIVALAGGPLAIALGVEARREKLDNQFTPIVESGDVFGIRVAQQPVSGERDAQALFAEASLPLARGVEAQLALRYDHYSDFGGTTNPKVALRWQPMKSLLLRSSWGTGFRAPPIYDLHTPQLQTFAFGEDPARCPVTGEPEDCTFHPAVVGGNPQLEPETSKQFNAGVVWEPAAGLSFVVDYWQIVLNNVIGSLNEVAIFDNFATYEPTNIIRGPVDPAYPGLPGPIQTVIMTNQNLGNVRTSGIDVGVRWRSAATGSGRFSFALDGTYVLEWKSQPDGLNYESALGRNSPPVIGPRPRWRHYAAFGWDSGPWAATLAQTYQSGYEDTNIFPRRVTDPPPPRQVSSYIVWDLQGRYTGWPNTTIVLGIKNLADRDPPFTNQPWTSQVGYDPTYADPRGRTFYARLSYAFK